MHILALYICNDNSDYFSLSRHFIHADDSVSVMLQCLHKTITFYSVPGAPSPTLSFQKYR